MKRLSPSFLLLSACALLEAHGSAMQAATAPADTVGRIVELGRTESQVMRFLDHVTNRIGPRLTGSDGYENACHWARDEFEALGLANARLERWGEFPVGFNRGPSSGRMLAPVARELRFGTNAWTAGTQGRVAGAAVLAPTNEAELEAIRPKLGGAWIVVKSAPTPARGAERRPAGADRAFREARDKAYDDAGIAGTIRAVRGELVLTGGSQKVDWNALPKRPSIQMVADDHAAIVEQIEKGAEVRLEFDIRNWFERGPIQISNVIAEIPGTEKPDEYVIVGGHLDSWDGATGALDNGTGVATTLEAARLLVAAGAKPKRTIRFMLWGGEEQGLLGSRAWIEQNKAELARISAVLVHDGGTNYCGGIPSTVSMAPLFESIFAPVKDLDPEHPFKVRTTKGVSPVGSDSDAFLAVGVPGLFWDQHGKSNYNHVHHTQFDTYEEAVPEYQRNSAIVIAVGALGIANLPDLLPRDGLRATGGGMGGRRLGVQLDEDMKITEVVDDGLAAKVGLLVGDKVVKIGDTQVSDTTELRTAMQDSPVKSKVVVLRGPETVEFAIEFPVDLDAPIRRYGMRVGDDLEVQRVTSDELAEKAGVARGDVITAVDGKAVKTKAEVSVAFEAAKGEMRLELRRGAGDKAAAVTVTLAKPESR
ncbi:MAG: M20/M25/M40 family metallo-hydrolase [Planctomycetota bacterium]|nr:M20/M25/M40 family metallo-hydrolase [Planctomycetota bacterium]